MSNVLNNFEQPTDSNLKDNIGRFDGTIVIGGTAYIAGEEFAATKLRNLFISNDVTDYNTGGTISIGGVAMIEGGTGIADLILPAPGPGVYCEIKLESITSGVVVVTTTAGVTFDGTNNTATFDAAGDVLRLGYKSATEWRIRGNESVVLSST